VSELLERDRELAELDALAADARAGAGRLAVIEAAAGLGKTRLVAAAREGGRRTGMRVLAARATELERDFPFALVRQLFAPVAGGAPEVLADDAVAAARGALGIAAPDAPPADAFAVLHALYWLTAALAEREPLLLAVDDAHWADAASLDVLRFLLPRLEELPALVVVACRPDEAGAAPALARITTDPAARRLTPRALSVAGAGVLLRGALGDAPEDAFTATCHEVSGGNPFLLTELARAVGDEGIAPTATAAARVRELAPDQVMRMVALRLGRLPEAAQAVARAVVVLGDGAEPSLVAAFAELDDEDAVASGADALRAAAILDPGPGLRFAHPLVRTALENERAAGSRAAAHARAAELLRARGASAERLALHLAATEARGDRATAATLLEAGRGALVNGAPRSASAWLLRALREPAPDDLRFAVLDTLVTAGARAPDRATFDVVFPEVLEASRQDPELRARWGTTVSMWLVLHGQGAEALRWLERGIAEAEAAGDGERAFHLTAQLTVLAAMALPEARARLEPYVEQLALDGVSRRLAAALRAEWAVFDGRAEDAVAAARVALEDDGVIFAEQPHLLGAGRPVIALILADELEAARRAAAQAIAHAQRRSAPAELVAAWWMSSGVAWAFGDLAAAESDARQGLEVARLGRVRLAELPLRAVLACVFVARGEVGAAWAEIEATGLTGEVPDIVWAVLVLYPRGLVRMEQGRFAEASEDFLQLVRLSSQWGAIGMPAPLPQVLAARALMASGRCAEARAMAAAALAHARRFGAPVVLSRALRASAVTSADAAARLALLDEAVGVLDGSPAQLARAEALGELGAALRRARRDVDARAPLREALDLARRCGAAGLAKTAFDELAATGERVRRWTPIGAESLTPSQRRVAELAAGGMTNRQIAQTLFLTVKTIESHLAAAYDTLGIRSRAELAAALAPR
jgi:DNA-binding NarL/FixJ family response regulator